MQWKPLGACVLACALFAAVRTTADPPAGPPYPGPVQQVEVRSQPDYGFRYAPESVASAADMRKLMAYAKATAENTGELLRIERARAARDGLIEKAAPELDGKALLVQHCGGCHGQEKPKRGFMMAAGPRLVDMDVGSWRQIDERLEAGTMPPADHPQPTPAQVQAMRKVAAGRVAAKE